MAQIIAIICHLIGDYSLQSSWMALEKTKRWFPAIVHALVYAIPFLLFIHPSWSALAVIMGTHAVIDRFRVARYLAFAKEFLSPPKTWKPWIEYHETGYHKDLPQWMSVWLMIIADNTLHIAINAFAIAFF